MPRLADHTARRGDWSLTEHTASLDHHRDADGERGEEHADDEEQEAAQLFHWSVSFPEEMSPEVG